MDKNSQVKRAFLWFAITALIGGAAFGMVKLAGPPAGEAGRAPAGQTALLSDAVSAPDWVKGDKDSKVVLVEYSDFQCPACRIFYLVLGQISKDYGDKIQLVYRHFPLSYHANAALAAQAAEAAGKQGRFWEMYDVLFENQDTWANQSGEEAGKTFTSYARALGLDADRFGKDFDSADVKAKIENDYQGGVKSGVDATPTFFLNGKKLPPPTSYEEFENTIIQAVSANP